MASSSSSDTENKDIETNSPVDNHSHEESDMEIENGETSSSNNDYLEKAETSSSSDNGYLDRERPCEQCESCERSISSSSSDTSSSSDPSEYCIKIERNWSDLGIDGYVPVVGLKNNCIVRRDSLSKLLKSEKPKHKRILNSIVTDAAMYDNYDAFERLLAKKYQLQVLNDEGQTALHLAFYHNSNCIVITVSDFIDWGEPAEEFDRTDYVDCNGLTHLHVASAYGSSSLVTKYLENNNYVNTHFRDNKHLLFSGFTPLHFAVVRMSKYYHVKSTQELIANGADVNAVDDQGRTPLHLVSRLHGLFDCGGEDSQMIKVMEVLVENESDVNAQDKNGDTPLFMIFTTFSDEYHTNPKKKDGINVRIGEAEEKLKFFLKLNVDLRLKNNNGNTLLHQVIESLKFLRYSYFNQPDSAFDDSRYLEIVKLVLTSGKEMDIDAKNNKGETPLQLAVSYLSFNIVQLLLQHNADIGDLKLSSNNDDFFKYMNVALSLRPVQKLVDILELLYAEGFLLTLEENLTILKFLTHNTENCLCEDMNFFKSRMGTFHMMCLESRMDIFHMMCLDLPEHVEKVMHKFYLRLAEYDAYDDNRSYDSIDNLAMNMLETVQEYFFCLKIGVVYADQKAINIMESALKNCETVHEFGFKLNLDENSLTKIIKEVEDLKSIFLVNDMSLHDVLMKNPEETAKYFTKSNFDEACIANLSFSKDIVKGHATKSLMKYYVQKFAYIHVSMLSESPLNNDCCQSIIRYLSVKDVLNICLALNF